MGLRAYLLVDVNDGIDQKEFITEMRQLEEMPGIDFVDPVIGPCDLIVMVDAPITVESIARKIQEKPWVKNIEILRIVSIYERHRSSKKELFKSLSHSGLNAGQ
jgi:hypothetical protein